MHYSAFINHRLYAQGDLKDLITKVKQAFPEQEALLIETDTCARLDINWQGSLDDVLARLKLSTPKSSPTDAIPSESTKAPTKRGRPKLGVVAKEVTLLPRHWEWLSKQSGGASVTLRRLVELARQENSVEDEIKRRQDQLYKFISIFAEQLPNVEETLRALYRQENTLFEQSIKQWPNDIRQFCEGKYAQIPSLTQKHQN
ncbi:DUF2239 family protein [Agaribacter marinus]|uniref:DUF2239 family protein n=1 Tax=Agaribacter marinus TaxID=1431249 RepID=A0AA37WGT2_9ALTE|nr:DUF2239 family protein [Agaribacter marinus]GLR70561.1 hypothetical protein GCM10007852_14690 [Agaribacter marinus]